MRKPLFYVAIALGMAAGPCYAQRAALPSPLQGQATACGVKAEVKNEFAASPARVQVLAERILAPGVVEQECALAGGARYKRIVKRHGAAQPLRLLAGPSRAEDTEGALLYEGFEGWDDTTKNWIPPTWSEINSTGEAGTYGNGAFTWYVSAQNGTLPNPVEGKYYCIIPYARVTRADKTTEDLPQDEWLVTPAVTPRVHEQLSFNISYSPLYLYDMSNENINFSTMEFVNRVVAATLKVYLRENGGEWKEIYDIEPAWRDYTLKQLFNEHFGQTSQDVVIPLDGYEGKKLEFAFRYVGLRGNTMELDKVMVDKAKLTVGYNRPAGAMYWGLSKDLEYPFYDAESQQAFTMLHVPAFTPLTWANTSSANVATNTWVYDDGTCANAVATTKDLATSYAPSRDTIAGAYGVPQLTVQADGFANASYELAVKGVYAGGAPRHDGAQFPLTLANVQKDGIGLLYNSQYVPLSGYHKYSKSVWTNMLMGKNPTDSNYVAPFGFLTKLEKPQRSYAVKRVWVMAYGLINAGTKLNFAFYRCSPDNKPYAPFASAECPYDSIVTISTGSSYNYYAIPFDLTGTEGGAPVIDRDAFGFVYGLDSEENNVIYLLQTVSYDKADSNSQYIYMLGKKDGDMTAYVMPATDILDAAGNELKSNLYMELETELPWLKAVGDTVATTGAAGGTVQFGLDSYPDASALNVAVAAADGGSDASWLSATGSGRNTDAALKVAVQPLPAGVTQRSATLTLSYPQCDNVVLIVHQNVLSGVDIVTAGTLVAAFAGDNLVVKNAQGVVEVYDVAGKLVGRAVAHGEATIATSPGHGVYIVRTAGRTVKVVK